MTHQRCLFTIIRMCQSIFFLIWLSNRNFQFVIVILSNVWRLTDLWTKPQPVTVFQVSVCDLWNVIISFSLVSVFILHCMLCLLGMGSCQWDMLRTSLRRWSQVRRITFFLVHVSCWFTWETTRLCALFVCHCISSQAILTDHALNDSQIEYELTQDVSDGLWLAVCILSKCVLHILNFTQLCNRDADETLQRKESDVLDVPLEDSVDCLSECPCYPQMPPPLLTIDHSTAGLVVLFWLKPVSLACLSCTEA